jgi:hypothetical protein
MRLRKEPNSEDVITRIDHTSPRVEVDKIPELLIADQALGRGPGSVAVR